MKSLDDLKIKYLIESRMQMTNSENDILVTADQYYWGYCIYFKFKDHKFKIDMCKTVLYGTCEKCMSMN